MKRRVFALLAALTLLVAPVAARAEAPAVQARGAVLAEVFSGRVLFEKDAHVRLPMASTTKIMTALVAIESCALTDRVAVPDEAYGVEGSSMYLARGEELLLSDLLYGLMLTSGNDAAIAIAHHVAGSVPAFAERMNARAKALGCTGTHFVNPNGLHDEEHYTTAADLAAIASAALQNPTFREIVGTSYHTAASGDRARVSKNKNRVLWEYDGGCGVKTGFTKAAGRCLVFAAERNGTLLVGVVLNCPDMWNDAYAMLDYGFSAVETRLFASAGTPVGTVKILGGEKKQLEVCLKEDILYPTLKNGGDRIDWRIERDAVLTAPVESGTRVGTATLLIDGREAAQTPLVTAGAVAAADVAYYVRRILAGFIAP